MTMPARALCACRSQFASLLACQMPLKSGLPSDDRVDRVVPGPTSFGASASQPMPPAITIAAKSALMIKARISSPLPQRIGVGSIVGKPAGESAAGAETERGWIGTLAGRELALRVARARQQADHPVVPFVAARLGIDAVIRVALPLHVVRHRPRLGPDRRILDCDGVAQRLGVDALPLLHQMQVLVSALIVGLLR